MEPIETYRDIAKSLSRDEFLAKYAEPFLVLDSAALRAVDRRLAWGKTMDRMVLVGRTGKEGPLLVAPLVPRDPQARIITIGLSPECDITIDDASISKQHAFFDRNGDKWRVWDNDSAAGTFVNDKPVEINTGQPLVPGDYITLGSVDVTFLTSPLLYGLVTL